MAALAGKPHLRSRGAPHLLTDVSIIIVGWNTRDFLRGCLQSLRDESGGVKSEVIVVDNASSDGSVEMIEREFPEVRVIRNAENRGFAAANNQGMAVASGRYVLLLNPDTRVLDRAVEKAVAFADAHPEAGVVGCRTLLADGSIQYNCYMFPSLLNLALSLSRLPGLFPKSRFFGRARMTWWDYESPKSVDVVAGCFMLVRREALEQVGSMAEDYFMYSEDTDWCWRFKQAGWQVLYTPEPAIVHYWKGSSSQCAGEMHVLQRRSVLMFLEKKSGKTVRRVANAMFCVSALARLAVLLLQRVWVGQRARPTREQLSLAACALRFHLTGWLPTQC